MRPSIIQSTKINVLNRLLNYPIYTIYDSTFYRVVAGLKGEITPRMFWESAYNYGEYRSAVSVNNVVDIILFNQAVAGGYDINGYPIPNGTYSVVNLGTPEPALDFFSRDPSAASVNTGVVLPAYEPTLISDLRQVDAKFVAFPFDLVQAP